MAGIGTADVTYTVKNYRRLGNSKVGNRVQLAFGDGAKTYSAGGIPLVIGNLGCPNVVESLTVVEQGTAGYLFSYISSTNKLAIFQTAGAAHNHTLFVASGSGTAGTQAVNALVANGVFNSGGSQSIAGISAASGTIGGIVTTTPSNAALAEVTSVAIAAQTIICEVIGW